MTVDNDPLGEGVKLIRPRGCTLLVRYSSLSSWSFSLPLVARRSSGRHKWTPFANTSSQSSRCPEMSMCRCTERENYHFIDFHKNQKKTDIQSKFLTGASTSSIGLKSSRGVRLSKSESRHCFQNGNVLIDEHILRKIMLIVVICYL